MKSTRHGRRIRRILAAAIGGAAMTASLAHRLRLVWAMNPARRADKKAFS
jgi:hypothetical protein